jgi:hypothetical protein
MRGLVPRTILGVVGVDDAVQGCAVYAVSELQCGGSMVINFRAAVLPLWAARCIGCQLHELCSSCLSITFDPHYIASLNARRLHVNSDR